MTALRHLLRSRYLSPGQTRPVLSRLELSHGFQRFIAPTCKPTGLVKSERGRECVPKRLLSPRRSPWN